MVKRKVFSTSDDLYIEANMSVLTVEAIAKNVNAKVPEIVARIEYLKSIPLKKTRFETNNGVTSMTSAQSEWEDENKPVAKPERPKHVAKIHDDLKSEYDR